MDIADLVDRQRYPIDVPGPTRDAVVARARAQIDADGCAVLKRFVRSDHLPALVAECDRVAAHAHRNFNRTNVYFSQDDPALPAGHPMRRFYPRSNAFVPADNFGKDSPLRAIYEWHAFAPFVQEVLGEDQFYRYADPLADVIVNLAEEGGGFP